MKKLKKDLQAVLKSLKALAKKTEKLIGAVDKAEKAQAVKERKAKAKAKTTKKPAAKKTTAKRKTKAKTTRKNPAKKKASALTATDQVIRIIKRSKKGVDAPTLIKKTGFNDKKVRNILMRASTQGKIKRAARGIYVEA